MTASSYYVYVYIDPRNFEEFYYGKGIGSRRTAHLTDEGDGDRLARIRAIREAGEQPIIRTVAASLTSEEALMIETALIWKLGKSLTNIASGHYVGKFRPPDTMHLEMANFDFQNGIYYVNVGEGETRNWDDCKQFGFLAAGGDPKWSGPLQTLHVGDVVVAYLQGQGYVGVGQVTAPAVQSSAFRFGGKSLSALELVEPNLGHDRDDLSICEYILEVDWLKAVTREEAKWRPKDGLFTTQQIRASLGGQPKTVAFVEREFDVDLRELADS